MVERREENEREDENEREEAPIPFRRLSPNPSPTPNPIPIPNPPDKGGPKALPSPPSKPPGTPLPPGTLAPFEKRSPSSRLVVVSTVYYAPYTGDTLSVESRYARDVSSDEQPYKRIFRITEEAKSFDVGWLSKTPIGYLVLSNDEPSPFTRGGALGDPIPSLGDKSLEVGTTNEKGDFTPLFLIPPGESLPFVPVAIEKLYYRAARESVRATLTAIPL
jgi:hypothetical protein